MCIPITDEDNGDDDDNDDDDDNNDDNFDCKDDIDATCNNQELFLEGVEILDNNDDDEDHVEIDENLMGQINDGDEMECNDFKDEECPDISSAVMKLDLDVALRDKIKHAPYPCRVKTKEEVMLFIELYENQKRTCKKVDFCMMANDWNQKLIKMLGECDHPHLVFKEFTFKTAHHLQKFQTTIVGKLKAKKIISFEWERLLQLQTRLRESDPFPQLGVITETMRKEMIAEIPDPVQETSYLVEEIIVTVDQTSVILEPTASSVPAAIPKQQLDHDSSPCSTDFGASGSSRKRQKSIKIDKIQKLDNDFAKLCEDYGSELIKNLYNRDISVCSKCLSPQKIKDDITTGHEGNTCRNEAIEYQGRLSWKDLKKSVRRLREAREKLRKEQ